MYPLILKPVIKDYIWGGIRVKKEYGYNSDKKFWRKVGCFHAIRMAVIQS